MTCPYPNRLNGCGLEPAWESTLVAMNFHLTQKSIFDKEQSRKDSQKQSGKTSRQLRREAAKKKKCGLEPARAPDAPHS